MVSLISSLCECRAHYCVGEMLFTLEDTLVLLTKLQEIVTRAAHGAGSDYLSVLAQITKGKDEKSATQRLQVVRLALAKYYARCGAIDVGGRSAGAMVY
jgi:nuclear pore complex protein Nup85